MNNRQARKILTHPANSKRQRAKLDKLYPPFMKENGNTVYPSWHAYYLFSKAWAVIIRKANKYRKQFKPL